MTLIPTRRNNTPTPFTGDYLRERRNIDDAILIRHPNGRVSLSFQFKDTGLWAALSMNLMLGGFCLGYIEHREGTPDREDSLEVHGGVTYHGHLEWLGDYPERNVVYYGFDCMHWDDQANPKSPQFALDEIEKLNEQLS